MNVHDCKEFSLPPHFASSLLLYPRARAAHFAYSSRKFADQASGQITKLRLVPMKVWRIFDFYSINGRTH